MRGYLYERVSGDRKDRIRKGMVRKHGIGGRLWRSGNTRTASAMRGNKNSHRGQSQAVTTDTTTSIEGETQNGKYL